MPIDSRDEMGPVRGNVAIAPEQPAVPQVDHSWLDIAAAGFRRHNPLSNIDFFGFNPRPDETPDPTHDPFDKLDKRYEPYAERFVGSPNAAHTQYLKSKIDRELYDRKVLSESGWSGVLAEVGGGVSNPIVLLSAFLGPAGWARTIGQVAVTEMASEAVLHQQQETRTLEESAINVTAAATVAGVLGWGLHRYAKYKAGKVAKLADDITGEPKVELPDPVTVQKDYGGPGIHQWRKEIYTAEGTHIGDFRGRINENTGEFFISNRNLFEEFQGKGHGMVASKEITDWALDQGYKVVSDSSVTRDAATFYQRLDPKKYKVWQNPNAVEKPHVLDVAVSEKYPTGKRETTRWVSESANQPVFIVTRSDEVVDELIKRDLTKLRAQAAADIKNPGGAAAREKAGTNVEVPQPDDFVPSAPWTPESVAARVDVPEVIAKHLSYGNPLMRLMSAPARATRSVAEHLLETPMYLRKNGSGDATAQSLETLIKVDHAATGEALQATRDAFNKSQGFGPGEINFIRARIKAGWGGEHHFKVEIGKALRRGGVHDDPLVAEAAEIWRAKVFDPLKERAMKLELFPEQQALRKELTELEALAKKQGLDDELTAKIAIKTKQLEEWQPVPKGADSYLTRIYDYNKLAHEADQFKAAVRQYLTAVEGYTEEEAKVAARKTFNAMMDKDHMFGVPKPEWRGKTRVPSKAGGPLAERTVTLPDNILEPWLISDIEHVGRTYTRRMATEINLAEKFGDRTMKAQIQAVRDEYEVLAEAAKTPQMKAEIHRAARENVRDIEAMRDMFIGTYGLPSDPAGLFARGNRVARSWQYITALGMQTISALPDMARPIVTNGLWRYGKGLTRAMPYMGKLAKEDIKRMGVGLDMLTSGRMRAIATMDEIPGVGGKFEHGMEELASGFGNISMMNQWNSFWKQFTGVLATDRIGQMSSRSWSKLKASERQQLAWLGIDEAKFKGIAEQFRKHGTKEGPFNVANIASWDHGPARDLMAAVNKEADTLIITPGKGDAPLLAKTDVGKTLFQFQSFTAAATNRMLLANIAQRDMRVVQGLWMGVVIGGLSAYIKDTINGRSVKWANDPAQIIARGIRQSGTLGLIAQIPADMATSAMAKEPIGKAAVQAIPGVDVPAERLVRSAGNVATNLQKGKLGQAAESAAGMLPYQNLFYLRMLLNEMDDGERSALGIKRPSGSGPAQSGSPFGG